MSQLVQELPGAPLEEREEAFHISKTLKQIITIFFSLYFGSPVRLLAGHLISSHGGSVSPEKLCGASELSGQERETVTTGAANLRRNMQIPRHRFKSGRRLA